MQIIDAHLHLSDLPYNDKNDFSFIDDVFSEDGVDKYLFCSSSHSINDYNMTCQLIDKIYSKYDISKIKICHSFGVHPQNPDKNLLSYLESILESEKCDIKYDKISAIGECGFDLFTPEFKSTLDKQKEVWNYQLELAIKYDKPIIVHCRKGMCHIFESVEKLKKIKAVIFHSFSGSMVEAQSILKKGINGFFSFGKPILNGNKNAIQCVKSLPLENILLETDSPYQTLKGEEVTNPSDIFKVYKEVFNLRQEDTEVIVSKVYENYSEKIFV